MSVVERFNYIEYSDATKFTGDTTGRIELAGYPDELVLYSSLDSDVDATYAASDVNAVIATQKPKTRIKAKKPKTHSIINSSLFGVI